jgi:hypothetical protein
MTTKHENEIGLPKIVEQIEWQKALDNLLIREKAATRARDALAVERRRLPMVRIDKNCLFIAPDGKVSLRWADRKPGRIPPLAGRKLRRTLGGVATTNTGTDPDRADLRISDFRSPSGPSLQ